MKSFFLAHLPISVHATEKLGLQLHVIKAVCATYQHRVHRGSHRDSELGYATCLQLRSSWTRSRFQRHLEGFRH